LLFFFCNIGNELRITGFYILKILWQDIKRALFECQSPEESECGSPKKKKRDPRRILSTSAPPSISGNNLLGKHPSPGIKMY
jgi:hypothetical protein